jgi:hypothetical protein
VNIDNHVGACGFFPIYPFITQLYPLRLVKVDEQTGEIVRENGLCIPCKPGKRHPLSIQSFAFIIDANK